MSTRELLINNLSKLLVYYHELKIKWNPDYFQAIQLILFHEGERMVNYVARYTDPRLRDYKVYDISNLLFHEEDYSKGYKFDCNKDSETFVLELYRFIEYIRDYLERSKQDWLRVQKSNKEASERIIDKRHHDIKILRSKERSQDFQANEKDESSSD